jgi:quercetin dioxygenase-like cupin family protein
MRLIASAILVAAGLGIDQTYPPPYPRTGTTSLIDNDRVQVWDVTWPQGAPSPLHRHLYDMTGVYYAPGDRVITAVDGSKRTTTTKAGVIQWQLKGVTHIEEGTSRVPLRAVMIELKGDGPSGKINAASQVGSFSGGSMPLLDNQRVTVWDYTRSSVPPAPHRHSMDTVVVWTDGRTGRAVFMPAGTVHSEEPIGSALKATIFELK